VGVRFCNLTKSSQPSLNRPASIHSTLSQVARQIGLGRLCWEGNARTQL
jgi:hypothetical protein